MCVWLRRQAKSCCFFSFFGAQFSFLLTQFFTANNLLKQRDCVKGDKIILFNELRISEWDSRATMTLAENIFIFFRFSSHTTKSLLISQRTVKKSIHICHVNSIFAYARYNVPPWEWSEIYFFVSKQRFGETFLAHAFDNLFTLLWHASDVRKNKRRINFIVSRERTD